MTDRITATAQRALDAARLNLIEATNDLGDARVHRAKAAELILDTGSEAGAAYLRELDDVVAHLETEVAIYRTERDAKARALDSVTR